MQISRSVINLKFWSREVDPGRTSTQTFLFLKLTIKTTSQKSRLWGTPVIYYRPPTKFGEGNDLTGVSSVTPGGIGILGPMSRLVGISGTGSLPRVGMPGPRSLGGVCPWEWIPTHPLPLGHGTKIPRDTVGKRVVCILLEGLFVLPKIINLVRSGRGGTRGFPSESTNGFVLCTLQNPGGTILSSHNTWRSWVPSESTN